MKSDYGAKYKYTALSTPQMARLALLHLSSVSLTSVEQLPR